MSKIDDIGKVYTVLDGYSGSNPYILKLKNRVKSKGGAQLNSFEMNYVMSNHDNEPKLINKVVKIADWWGVKKQKEYEFEFTPEKVKITWYLGEVNGIYHFYGVFRRSQTAAYEIFASKKAILTDFLSEPYENTVVNFADFPSKSGKSLYLHQESAVKFLVSRKKAILADSPGYGKTASAIVASLAGGFKRILVICPASLKKNWENELSDYVDKDEITIVEGSTWKENKYTIINYDILKNFYTLPTEMKTKSQLEVNDEGDIVRTEKDVEVISRKKDIINNAMENSQLYQSKFDLIIIDEAHKLSNTSSGFFKIVSDLVKRSNPEAIYELTGTPITNKPINFYNILKIIDSPIADDWQYYVERYCDGKKFYNKKEREARTIMFLRIKKKASWYDLTDKEKDDLNQVLDKYCKKQWSTGGASYLEDLQEAIKTCYLRRDKQDLKMVKKSLKMVKYDLSDEERKEYDKVWDEFAKDKQGKEELKALMEGIAFRQWLANKMTSKTIALANKLLAQGEKVIIFCTFDEELNTLKEAFKGICVIHNGKMLPKKKNESVVKFQTDPECKVFIGNIISAGVGLTLTASSTVIFNSIDYVPGNCEQAEDRVHRLNQTKDCTIYYQVFNDTYMEKMFDIIHSKSNIINTVIISERNK